MLKKSGYYIDDHALLFAWLARAVLRREPVLGISLIENWVSGYGHERGGRAARRCLQDGQALTVPNYYVYSEWQDERGWNVSEMLELAPLHIHTNACGWYSSWKEHGLMDYGKLYCRWIDQALVRGFNPDLLLKMPGILSEGHEHCDFKWPGCRLGTEEFAEMTARRAALAGRVSKDFQFHVGHLYNALSRVLLKKLGPVAAEDVLEQGLADYAACYGPEKARQIKLHSERDYTLL